MTNTKGQGQGAEMNFALESEMSAPVQRWLRGQRLAIKQEFATPWGICDLVGISFNKEHVKQRIAFGQHEAIGPLHRIQLLRRIPEVESGMSVTMSRLAKVAFGLDTKALETELKRLISGRFVIKKADGSLQKLNGWAPLHRRLVAVELKLSRITEVLSQAASNRAFADESYVAMPAEIAKRVALGSRASEFLSAGVGILAVTSSRCKVVLLSSQSGVPVDLSLQMHCAERFWRTKGSSS